MVAVRSLYLLRHAKSSWDDPGLGDHARPLSPRGEGAARDLAAYFHREAIEPALVLCSTAVRARQTLQALSLRSEVCYEDDLYGASAAELLARLRRISEEIGSVMVVGHNPGLHELAVSFSEKGDAVLLARLCDKLPTGTFVKLAFPGPWASLAERQATLEALVMARHL